MENTFEHADLFQEELDGAANLIDSVVDLGAPLLEDEPPEDIHPHQCTRVGHRHGRRHVYPDMGAG